MKFVCDIDFVRDKICIYDTETYCTMNVDSLLASRMFSNGEVIGISGKDIHIYDGNYDSTKLMMLKGVCANIVDDVLLDLWNVDNHTHEVNICDFCVAISPTFGRLYNGVKIIIDNRLKSFPILNRFVGDGAQVLDLDYSYVTDDLLLRQIYYNLSLIDFTNEDYYSNESQVMSGVYSTEVNIQFFKSNRKMDELFLSRNKSRILELEVGRIKPYIGVYNKELLSTMIEHLEKFDDSQESINMLFTLREPFISYLYTCCYGSRLCRIISQYMLFGGRDKDLVKIIIGVLKEIRRI